MKTFDFSMERTTNFECASQPEAGTTRFGSFKGLNPFRKRRLFWMLAGLLAVMLAVCAANAGRWLVVDAPQPSDVILVLAGETDRRPARALELLDHGYGRRVVIDVPVTSRIYDSTQLQLAQKWVEGLPQAASVQICPIEGLSTREESHDVEKCLAGEAGRRILIVTSEFHTRRAIGIFRREVRGRSFSVAAAKDETQFGTRWWTHRQWAKTCLDEWMKMAWWIALERWR
jgi:hypothetical protein